MVRTGERHRADFVMVIVEIDTAQRLDVVAEQRHEGPVLAEREGRLVVSPV
jgi:hypothetical protein